MNNWTKLRLEFVYGEGELKELAQGHGIAYDEARLRCRQEGWRKQRQRMKQMNLRMEELTGRVLDAVDRALAEADLATKVVRTKEKLENGERTTEEHMAVKGACVDVKTVKTAAEILKLVRDLSSLRDPMDRREQEIKIRNLERQLESTAGTNITVKLEDGAEEFAR